MDENWEFAGTAQTSNSHSPVDTVGEWFRAERGWEFSKAYDRDDREIVHENFEFEWFHSRDGTVVFNGYIDASLSEEDAVNLAMSIYEVFKQHGRPCSLEFYDGSGNQTVDIKDS